MVFHFASVSIIIELQLEIMIDDDALVNAITARYVDNLNKEKLMCLSSFARPAY